VRNQQQKPEQTGASKDLLAGIARADKLNGSKTNDNKSNDFGRMADNVTIHPRQLKTANGADGQMQNRAAELASGLFATLPFRPLIGKDCHPLVRACAGWTAALLTPRAPIWSRSSSPAGSPAGCLPPPSIVENFPGFPEGVDGYELMARIAKTGRTLWRAGELWHGRGGGFFQTSLRASRWTANGLRRWRSSSPPARATKHLGAPRRGFAGNQRRDVLRHV